MKSTKSSTINGDFSSNSLDSIVLPTLGQSAAALNLFHAPSHLIFTGTPANIVAGRNDCFLALLPTREINQQRNHQGKLSSPHKIESILLQAASTFITLR